MKQKDIATIIAVAGVSALVSIFVSGKLFASGNARSQTVEQVPVIQSSFPTPDPKYFNSQSIDPTAILQLTGNNPLPFNNNQ